MEPKCVYWALRPLHLLTTLFGLACYESSKSSATSAYVVTKLSVTRCVLLVIVYLTGISFASDFNPTVGSALDDRFLIQIQSYNHIISDIMALVIIILSAVCFRTIIAILKQIDGVDHILNKHGLIVDYKKTYINTLASICVLVVVAIGVGIYKTVTSTGFTYRNVIGFFNYVPYILKFVQELQYFHYMQLIEIRFRAVNVFLVEILSGIELRKEKWLEERRRSNICIGCAKEDEHGGLLFAFDMISVAHLKLCDTALLLNRTFSVQLLLLINSCFLGSVSALYILVVYSHKDDLKTWNVMYTLWTCANSIKLILIICIVSRTGYQAAGSAKIFHRIRNTVEDTKLQESLEDYSMQMHSYRLQFDVCGLFPLDYTLLNTIIAGVTTYLIIVVQFQTGDNVHATNSNNIGG